MGLRLPTPLVVSASPLSRDVATVRRLERAGAGAIVLYSLFEEQFRAPLARRSQEDDGTETGAFLTTPEGYVAHIRALKDAVGVPIIASLNASSPGAWLDYAADIERAGADALELDLYRVVADPTASAAAIEDAYARVLACVRAAVSIPVAVKLAPYFTNLAAAAHRFDAEGAAALVLFNRYFLPTIDIERRRLVLDLELSTSADSRIAITWIAMLAGQVRCDLAATGGIHGAPDVVRAVMAGAQVVMLCSALLRHGVDRMADVHRLLVEWLETHGHESLEELRGAMRLAAQPEPDAFKRGGYAKILNRFW
jgi:dihydroorotate dehydrogenase (fumarate)